MTGKMFAENWLNMYSITSSVFFTLCLPVAAYLLYKLLLPAVRERKIGRKLLQEIDGPPPHWLFGHLNVLKPNQEAIMEICKKCKEYPKIGLAWFGPFLSYVMLHHPHVLKPVLSISERKDDLAYRFIQPWIGDGLLVSSGKKWQRNRHLLTRAFHFDVLKHYVKTFNSCTTTLLEKWSDRDEKEQIEMFEHVSLMTLDSMLQCAISCKTDCQTKGTEHRYISAVYTLTTIAMKRIFNPFFHSDFLFSLCPSGRKFKAACDYVHEYDEKVIRERKMSLQKLLRKESDGRPSAGGDSDHGAGDLQRATSIRLKNDKFLDFLDMLLLTRDEDGKGLTDREVRDEVDTFLFEGHDTTASGLSWAFYCLATHPEYQETCREEVRRVMSDQEEVLWEHLSEFSYLTMFIKEVLRLYPPVFAIARKLSRPVAFDRGFGDDQHCLDEERKSNNKVCRKVLEPSTNVGIPLLVLHRNETVWENPQIFDPSRFTKEKSASRSNFAYLPFSAGPRNCIGQNFAMAEMKVAIARALVRFRFFVTDDCLKPEMSPMIVLKSTNGIRLRIEKLT